VIEIAVSDDFMILSRVLMVTVLLFRDSTAV
jgi:hypothetical protein